MSLDDFVKNITPLEGLSDVLHQAAQIELGPTADSKRVEKRATQLLVEAMVNVGVDPKSEQRIRKLIFDALRGSHLTRDETVQLVEYLLGQMIAKPKGALAERLARIPCWDKIAELQRVGALPPETEYLASIWSKRTAASPDGSETPRFSDWRDGADGLVLCRRNSHAVRHLTTGATLNPDHDAVLVLAVVEVKARRALSKGEPALQLNKHLARLTQGFQTRDNGRITSHCGERCVRGVLGRLVA
jgi:hypothetical protein